MGSMFLIKKIKEMSVKELFFYSFLLAAFGLGLKMWSDENYDSVYHHYLNERPDAVRSEYLEDFYEKLTDNDRKLIDEIYSINLSMNNEGEVESPEKIKNKKVRVAVLSNNEDYGYRRTYNKDFSERPREITYIIPSELNDYRYSSYADRYDCLGIGFNKEVEGQKARHKRAMYKINN